MKKTIFALFALLAVLSCAREEIDLQPFTPDREKDSTPISFNLSVNGMSGGAQTKAALKADWADGDVVYVFFDAIGTKYVKKTFDGTEWADTYPGGAFVAGDFSASGSASSRNMTAVWFPQGAVDVTYAAGKFSFTIGGEKIYSHYMSVLAAYSIDGTTVTGTLDMEKPAGFVQFFVPGIDADAAPAYRLMESNLTPKACDYVALAGDVTESALTPGYSLKGMAFTSDASVTGALFGGYLSSAGTTTSYKFSLVKEISADKPAAEGTYTLMGYRNIAAGTSMTFPAIASGAWGAMSPFVDLGFGDIQWATGNLRYDEDYGVIVSPLAAGDFFQWGAKAAYGSGMSGDECIYDDVDQLSTDNDIAYYLTYGEWHMPSQAQFEALISPTNTTTTWVTIESAKGRLITSKVNGISLFFIAAGGYVDGSLNDEGVWGHYWSTTPDDASNANDLLFSNWLIGTNKDLRELGMSVRPIKSAPTLPKLAAEATAGDLGKVIGSDGFIYNDAAAATAAGTTALALITYVGNDAETSTTYNHGLALALTDASTSVKWCSQTEATCLANQYEYIAAKTDMAGIANTDYLINHAPDGHTHGAASAARNYNGSTHPTGTSAWFLPSAGQWEKMVNACKNVLGTNNNYTDLRDGFSTRGGTNLQSDSYWSSTERNADMAWSYYFYDGEWYYGYKASFGCVRSAIAF